MHAIDALKRCLPHPMCINFPNHRAETARPLCHLVNASAQIAERSLEHPTVLGAPSFSN
jgi:hypothetical protein